MSTTETKCPTCGGPALDRSGFWETCWTPVPVAADASARIAHERANRLSARVKEQSEEIEQLRAEIIRLRTRLSDAEYMAAVVRRGPPEWTEPQP